MALREVRPERTGWRDQEFSDRHRKYGWDCPMVDIDFLVGEFNSFQVAAVVEYKREHNQPPGMTPQVRTLRNMADKLDVPFIVVHYFPQGWWFRIYPLNEHAKQFYTYAQVMTEREYVASLYNMRKRVVERNILQVLSTFKPEAK